MPDCPNCQSLRDSLHMAMEEHTEIAGEQQDRIEGLLKVNAAYRGVAVQRMRGFVLQCPPVGPDVWVNGRETELAGEFHCQAVWEINDAYRKAVNGDA